MSSCKGLTATVLFVLLASPSYAQPGGGLEIGPNFSKVSLSGSEAAGFDGGYKTGVIVGGFATLPVNETIAIVPEVAYAQKHSKLSGSEGGETFSQNLALDFVEIPILVKLTPANAQGFYVVFGPGFGFRTRAKTTDTKFNGQSFPEGDEDLKDDTESVDVSLIGGAGLVRGRVGFEARYDHGLRNLNNDSSEDFKVNTRTVTVLLRLFLR